MEEKKHDDDENKAKIGNECDITVINYCIMFQHTRENHFDTPALYSTVFATYTTFALRLAFSRKVVVTRVDGVFVIKRKLISLSYVQLLEYA